MELLREHGKEDAELISALIVLTEDLRREGEDHRADIVTNAMCRIHELTKWIDAEVEVPPDDTIVLAVVNGRLGSITFINSIEPAQYFGEDGWLLESFIDVESGSGDEIEIRWWMPLPEPPAAAVMEIGEVKESEVD